MKEMFVFLWTSAPEVMSLLVILGMFGFLVYKLTRFFNEFEQLGVRVTALEKKVDMILEFLITKLGK
jgi:flagellar biogenesis protein FliO